MKCNCLLNYDVLSVGEEHRVYLLVKVLGPTGDSDRKPLPINLSVVIDRSGSMSGSKLQYVKQAAQELVQRLGSKDRLSLVAYDTQVEVLIPPRKVKDKRPFDEAIQKLDSRATTNLSGGWLQGCEFVRSKMSDKGVNRVLLLTDGLANAGITEPVKLESIARQKRSEGVTTTAFGVGMDFNEDLLTRMASEGGGAFYFIDSPDQAPTFFAEELSDLYNVVGQNLTISLSTEPIVRGVTQLYDYPHQHQDGRLVYRLGDLYADEERYQVFELSLGELEEGETTLGEIQIAYDAIEGEEVKRRESAFEIKIKALPEEELEVVLPVVEVEKLALLQKVRQAREQALKHADLREFKEAKQILEDMAAAIKESGIEDDELQDEYDLLLEEAMDMEFGQERFDAHARKLQSMKSSTASRHSRYSDTVYDSHLRHKHTQMARERGGPAPQEILWRGGQMNLTGDEIALGSSPDNDLQLTGKGIEDHHCHLQRIEGEWVLVNLSQQGTIANGGLVRGPFRLSEGDVLRLGEVVLRLR